MIPLVACSLVFAATFLLIVSSRSAWDTVSGNFVADQWRQARTLGIQAHQVRACLRLWGGLLLLDFVLIGLMAQAWLLAMAVAGLLFWSPRWLFEWVIARRIRMMRDQMVSCCIAMSNAARAGQSLVQGLKEISQETPEPLASELQRIVAEYEHGRPLTEALQEAKQRLKLDSFTMFASSVIVSLQRGGRITLALERISRSLQENQRIERKLASETASGWRVVLILAAFPLLFLGGFSVLYPEGTWLLFHSLFGQFLLLVILGLVVASVYWSRRILSIEI